MWSSLRQIHHRRSDVRCSGAVFSVRDQWSRREDLRTSTDIYIYRPTVRKKTQIHKHDLHTIGAVVRGSLGVCHSVRLVKCFFCCRKRRVCCITLISTWNGKCCECVFSVTVKLERMQISLVIKATHYYLSYYLLSGIQNVCESYVNSFVYNINSDL